MLTAAKTAVDRRMLVVGDLAVSETYPAALLSLSRARILIALVDRMVHDGGSSGAALLQHDGGGQPRHLRRC
jgi:hypothetical protein